jgi:hypothetical protein
MSYAEWLELFEKFNNTNLDKDQLNYLLSLDNNPSIQDRLTEKYSILLNNRLQLSVNKLISELDNIFNDQNYMDFMLVSFKKEVDYIIQMLQVKILTDESRNNIRDEIKNKVDEIMKIMDDKALEVDYTGVLSMMIKNNGIKWS